MREISQLKPRNYFRSIEILYFLSFLKDCHFLYSSKRIKILSFVDYLSEEYFYNEKTDCIQYSIIEKLVAKKKRLQ